MRRQCNQLYIEDIKRTIKSEVVDNSVRQIIRKRRVAETKSDG